MTGWRINDVNLSGTRIENVNLAGVEISNCRLAGARIDGVAIEDLFEAFRKQRQS